MSSFKKTKEEKKAIAREVLEIIISHQVTMCEANDILTEVGVCLHEMTLAFPIRESKENL